MNIGQIFKLFLAVAAVWPLGAVAVDPVGRASWEYMSAAALGRRTRSFPELGALPRTIATGDRGPFHVQGIAVDLKRGHIYFSFTTQLLKFDLQGRLIGSVDGLTGHLGCLTMNPDDGRVYGSLEYKDDAIGQGIRSKLTERDAAEVEASDRTGFYVAIFDVDRITRPGMDAERDRVMTTVYIGEAVADYRAQVTDGGSVREHRFGCSGIDGVTFGPRMGTRRGNLLYVAYGIYGDTLRHDNDYQVLLAYDTKDWHRYEAPLSQENLHRSGPAAPEGKYFVRTGNTRYGVQNLAYDPASGNFYMAVYRGSKSCYPNYSLFVVDGSAAPRREPLIGTDGPVMGEVLSLLPAGKEENGIRGWDFPWGTTGLCPLGGGYFYISHEARSEHGEQSSTVHLYEWTGDEQTPFRAVE